MNRLIKITLSVLSAGLFTACGSNTGSSTAQQATAPREEKPTLVKTAAAIMQEVPQRENYASVVEANAINNIAPQSGNRIRKINVEVGDFVYSGQILAEMDRVQLDQARLKLLNDSTELSRLRGLFEEGGVSRSDFEARELAYNVSRVSYKNLEENTILRAPISGVITARNFDRGDMFSMSKPIYVLQQITPVKLIIGVSESDYTKVRKGSSVSLTVEAIPGRTFEGTINRIHPTIDAATHTFSVEVVVPNRDRALRPGMYARVEVTFGVNRSIVVPDEAVVKLQGSGQRSVFIVKEDNTVVLSEVTLGRHFGTSYEILSGVSEGDIVVTKGNSSLKNGAKVEISE